MSRQDGGGGSWWTRLRHDTGGGGAEVVTHWSEGPVPGWVATDRESPVHFIRATFKPESFLKTSRLLSAHWEDGEDGGGSLGEPWKHYFFYYCYSCLSFTEGPCRTESLSLSLSLQHRAFLSLSSLYFLLLLYLLWHVVTLITRIAFLFYVCFFF